MHNYCLPVEGRMKTETCHVCLPIQRGHTGRGIEKYLQEMSDIDQFSIVFLTQYQLSLKGYAVCTTKSFCGSITVYCDSVQQYAFNNQITQQCRIRRAEPPLNNKLERLYYIDTRPLSVVFSCVQRFGMEFSAHWLKEKAKSQKGSEQRALCYKL